MSEAWREKLMLYLKVKFRKITACHFFFSFPPSLVKKNQPQPLQDVLLFTEVQANFFSQILIFFLCVYSYLVTLLLVIVISQLLQPFTVAFPHFTSIQFHCVFNAFHLCVHIHHSQCFVPFWVCISNSHICTLMFEFSCLTYALFQK